MSNMSYCQFENTSRDLSDCYETMNEQGFDKEELSSEHEQEGYTNLIELCCNIALEFGHEIGKKIIQE